MKNLANLSSYCSGNSAFTITTSAQETERIMIKGFRLGFGIEWRTSIR
jgi:hypothetical protein